ncbi:MAG: acyl-CoA dehydratase activase-related protein [Peptococcaceae bacterium]|nr:acyl-CoA dehydratase activase-related protein [Peptococcaceae bacterium]MDH7525303.1 acyl-CoA dehydratase activase-related protein [Peptococcaceae bacterium]
MIYKIGIPRALLYYEFAILWRTFFNCLDMEVVVSGKTNKRVLDEGALRVADEACLPVKIFFGHAVQLAGQEPDFLFVPRIVSIERKAYACPKVIGLPDMLEAGRDPVPPLLKPTINLAGSPARINFFFQEIDRFLGCGVKKIRMSWQKAVEEQKKEDNLKTSPLFGKGTILENAAAGSLEEGEVIILLLGHQYLIEDSFLNLNVLKKLKCRGCLVLTPLEVPFENREAAVSGLPKKMFWTFGKTLLGAARCFTGLRGEKGAVILTSFGCGIDSFVVNMIVRHFKKAGIPQLSIVLDEHTGEAGVDTRIEAFLDMICWRKSYGKDYFSSHGPYMGNIKGAFRIP